MVYPEVEDLIVFDVEILMFADWLSFITYHKFARAKIFISNLCKIRFRNVQSFVNYFIKKLLNYEKQHDLILGSISNSNYIYKAVQMEFKEFFIFTIHQFPIIFG